MIGSIPSVAVTLPTLTCGRCLYSWWPRYSRAPKRCPSCGTPEWFLGGTNSAARLPSLPTRAAADLT